MTAQEIRPEVGDRPAVVVAGTGEWVDHARFRGRAELLGALLAHHGVEPGDSVALLSGTSPAALEVLAATRRTGSVMLPLDPSFSLEELAYAINVSASRVLLVAEDLADAGCQLEPLTPYVQARYSLGGAFDGHRALAIARSAVVTGPAPSGVPAGTLHYSVAATGRPSGYGVPDPLGDTWGRRDLAAYLGRASLDGAAVVVAATSLSDPACAQVVSATLDVGGTVVVPARTGAVDVLRAVFEHDATIVLLTPLQAVGIAKLDPARRERLTPPGLELVLLSVPGSPPHVVRALVESWGDAVRQVYLGPGVGVLTAASGDELVEHPGSLGALIVDGPRLEAEDDQVLRAEDPSAPGEWRTWGDRGLLDEQGHLHLLDRDAFALEPGGEVVVPRDLETALVTHPSVADVAVLGVPDADSHTVRVFVEVERGVRPGADLETELLEHLRSRVPASWVPAQIDFTSVLPRTATGKLDKRRLRRHDPMASGGIV